MTFENPLYIPSWYAIITVAIIEVIYRNSNDIMI